MQDHHDHSLSKRTEIIHRLRAEITALESRLDPNNRLIVSLREQLAAHENQSVDERRTQIYRRAAIEITPEAEGKEFSQQDTILFKDMSEMLVVISSRLDHKFAEMKALNEISERINAGMFLNEVLDHIFENLEKMIPYDRVSVALIEKGSEGQTLVHWVWARAKYKRILLNTDFSTNMEDTGLLEMMSSRVPRIIDDLQGYIKQYPKATPIRMVLNEGIRSSLSCPLIIQNEVIGFIFFSSLKAGIFNNVHIDLFLQVSSRLSQTLEKSRAYEDLYLRNEFIRKVFGQHVTTEIAEAALSADGQLTFTGEHRKVTVLMADLRGFTPLSETLPPEAVVQALNVFLGAMMRVIMDNGGNIDNIIGDAVMAVFGVPLEKPDDVARAVACAIEMQNTMTMVNEETEARGLPALEMGIGLSTGEVIAGNIGSEMRVKYSVIGKTVNHAARMESIASGGQIFADSSTISEIRDTVHTGGCLSVKLKGIDQPEPIYEIVGIGDTYNTARSMTTKT